MDAFKDTGTSASALLAKLDERWRELVAYNAARAEAANVILTDAKIAQLQTEYHLRGDVDGLYNDIAIMQMADGLASLNGYLATRQSNILRACANLQGYKALEDQRDALAYSTASMAVITGRGEFVPLEPLIKRSAAFQTELADETKRIHGELPGRPCGTRLRSIVTLEWPKLLTSEAQVLQAAVRREFRTSHNLAKPRISQKCLACGYIRTGLLRS